jgi:hypothetical protein
MPAALLLALLAAADRPAATLEAAPAVVRPGDAVLVRLRGPAAATTGAIGGRPLRFWRRGDEQWAIGALPIETPPGPLSVRIEAPGPGVPAATTVEVVEPGFPSRALRVAPRFVAPPASAKARIARDREAFARALDRPFAPPAFSLSFAWPHPGARRGGRFGDQRTFNGKQESVHYGLDIEAPRGAPVRAANDGEVVLARDAYYSGKTVVIWHGADLFTLYFHMDRLLVRAGARVRRGERIGVVGSTGRSTGPHLHWSAKVGELYVDPESLVGIDFASGTAPPRRAGPPPAVPDGGPAAPPEGAVTAGGAPRR